MRLLSYRRRSRVCAITSIALLMPLVCGPAFAAPATVVAANLADLSLEQLGNIEITSVSRRSEKLADAAASIFVISADDIRRSGATTLPEALRLAPNLQVARADANQYAITARGYNSTLANKMLVMIDGRTVYSPLFSGVFWEAQNVVLEDIDRIEVISGPGGTLWGSNAVNGVINIITRSSAETQGTMVAAGVGNQHGETVARRGGETDGGGHYRIYAKFNEEATTKRANGTSVGDASHDSQIGFRSDWGGPLQSFTLQGDAYHDLIDQPPSDPRKLTGYNLLGRWNRHLDSGSDLSLQAYYDRVERVQPNTVRDTLDTYDLEYQQSMRFAQSHNLLWGAGFRYAPDRTASISQTFAFIPSSQTARRSNVFVQDDFALLPTLTLTLGLKLERNEYTGTETLPNLRLAWKNGENSLIWGALSRAVRAPSRIDREVVSPATPPYTLLAGGPNFESEVANVAELGYRAQILPALSVSATAYHMQFDRLRSTEPSPVGPVFANKIEGSTSGLEAWGTLSVTSYWRLHSGFVTQRERRSLTDGSTNLAGLAALGNDPPFWWNARSTWDLGSKQEFDLMVRHVAGLPNPSVPGYTAVDARLGWKLQPGLELSLTAQNLFDRSHPEWGAAATRAEFTRGIFAKVLWRL
jgi:iron complex outermembrane receptor protein